MEVFAFNEYQPSYKTFCILFENDFYEVLLTLCVLDKFCMRLLSSADFFQNQLFLKNSFMNII